MSVCLNKYARGGCLQHDSQTPGTGWPRTLHGACLSQNQTNTHVCHRVEATRGLKPHRHRRSPLRRAVRVMHPHPLQKPWPTSPKAIEGNDGPQTMQGQLRSWVSSTRAASQTSHAQRWLEEYQRGQRVPSKHPRHQARWYELARPCTTDSTH